MPGKAKILVVDDSRSQLEWITKILTGDGYRVTTAADGREALRKWHAERPDLVLLDMILPDMDGLQVLRFFKQRQQKEEDEVFVPVILLSVKADLDSRVKGLQIGADDFLAKPFADAEVLARAAAMLRIKALQDQLRDAKKQLEKLSIEDGLTKLFNHRHFQEELRREFGRAARYNDPLSLIMIDLDHFKTVNDNHGHPFGDKVLRESAARIRGSVRDTDICARYGGEEFVVILPKTPLSGALKVATRIHESFRENPFVNDTRLAPRDGGPPASVTVTTSLGVASYPSPQTNSAEALVKSADEALYRAKKTRDAIAISHAVGYAFDAKPQ
ncbi:MAG TPA: diguanylate cyclase [Anaeromyxobacteraceae bacterium]|nr:diguanylate cyclase [Anaeromyxobacteraceae bacterium]